MNSHSKFSAYRRFDNSIDKISDFDEQTLTELPSGTRLAPTGHFSTINFDQLLGHLPIQERALLGMLAPRIRNPFVLAPDNYSQLLEAAAERLQDAAAGATASARSQLHSAAELIDCERQMMRILDSQRQRMLGA